MIRRSSRRWQRLVLFEAAGLAVAVPLAWLWMVFVADNLFHLSRWLRISAAAVFLLVVLKTAWGMARRFRRARFSEDQVALAIESETPDGMENRLINAVQIPRGDAAGSEDFTAALLRENYDRLHHAELRQAAHSRRAVRIASVALLVTVAGIGFWTLRRDHFNNAATRFFMPFADVAPLYRTVLTVDPGNTNAPPGRDVVINIGISGQRPPNLSVIRVADGRREVDTVPVPRNADQVAYHFRNLENTVTYAVRGGDFTTPQYTITVLAPPRLQRIRAVYNFPGYTGKEPETVESVSGDIEALFGTRVHVLFTFDQPVDSAVMITETSGNDNGILRTPLEQVSATVFGTEIVLRDQRSYRLETRRAGQPPGSGTPHAVRVFADQPPRLRLSGLQRSADVMIDAALPLEITAADDYGLLSVGLFMRSVAEPAETRPDWVPVRKWSLESGSRDFTTNLALMPAELEAVEGGAVEVALRGRDNDPLRDGAWTEGEVYRVRFAGDEAALQTRYETILRVENSLQTLLSDQQQAIRQAARSLQDLDPARGRRWDDAANLQAFAETMRTQAAEQERMRREAARIARDMPADTGNMRIGVGMLADTEMVRAIRILESVPGRDTPPEKRAALADARLTMERITRSLNDLHDRFVSFRRDWELAHMIPFTGMLAERQTAIGRESESYGALPPAFDESALRSSTVRRQQTVQRLSGLAGTAFHGLDEWLQESDPLMAQAFATAAVELRHERLSAPMENAVGHLTAGDWEAAAEKQQVAAETLAQIHLGLRIALAEAARRALEDHQQLVDGDLEMQRELERLQAGTDSAPLLDAEGRDIQDESTHLGEAAAARASEEEDEPVAEIDDRPFEEWMRNLMHATGDGSYATLDDFHLAGTPSEQAPAAPPFSDLPPTEVIPFLQETFDDLVGELLDEADLLEEQYMTYNLISAASFAEPGHPGKGGMPIGRTSASAPTGNEKPPTAHVGGASRSGRQGARSHGMVVGDETVDRRGRDAVQDGHETVPDQEGLLAYEASEDTQDDVSTGIGGKLVDHPDTHFSLQDSGEWTDDMIDRMRDAQEKHNIVERQGDPFDHQVAELMRDMTSTQQQVIERLKTIRKELTNLYLPTDHLDEVLARLEETLARLDEPPGPDLFRLQAQALDLLRGTVVVFHGAHSGHFPSVPRDQNLQGRILDEPPWQPLPGYEAAVKQYYEKLALP